MNSQVRGISPLTFFFSRQQAWCLEQPQIDPVRIASWKATPK
jgi:hypothetical protein